MEIDLEDQYKCCNHSVKYNDPDLVLSEFTRITLEATEKAKATIPHELDIPYGDTPRQRYDLYGTDLPATAGILVFLHGGYWQALDKSTSATLVPPVYNQHLKVVVVDYDLTPQVKLQEIIAQIEVFGRHILGVAADIGSAGVWFAGHSAGAHLASCLLNSKFQESLTPAKQALLKGLILISGIYDIAPLLATTKNNALQLTPDDAEKVSTDKLFDKRHPVEILITLASKEPHEFRRQSQVIHEKALKAGTPSEFLIMEKNDHFTIIENLNDKDFQLTQKILSFIKNKK